MTEAVQEQQQTEQVEPQVPLSDEEIVSRAMGDRPRDEQGRFVAQKPGEEKPAEEASAAEQQPEAEAAEKPEGEPEYKWDDLKAVKIKFPTNDGKEEELTLEELREQRMLKADYTRKTQELAEQRRQTDTATQAAVEKERTAYLASLETLRESIVQAASPELASVDWNKLAHENPAEYVRLSNRAREVNAALERVRFEQEKVQHQQAKERDDRLAQAVAESKTKLLEAIPNWSDDLYNALLKRGTDTYGFKADEVGQVWDHRVMQVLHDAHQFRMLKEQKPATEKKVVSLPPVLKPGSQKPKVDAKQQEFQQAQQRLRANGNDADAAADLMAAFLKPK